MSDESRAAFSTRTVFALSGFLWCSTSLGCQRDRACQEHLQRVEAALDTKSVAEAEKLVQAASAPCADSDELSALRAKVSAATDRARLEIKEDQWKRDNIMQKLATVWDDLDSTPPASLEKDAVEAAHRKALEIGANPPERFKSHVEQSIRVQYEKRRRLVAGEATPDEVQDAEARHAVALQKRKSQPHGP